MTEGRRREGGRREEREGRGNHNPSTPRPHLVISHIKITFDSIVLQLLQEVEMREENISVQYQVELLL